MCISISVKGDVRDCGMSGLDAPEYDFDPLEAWDTQMDGSMLVDLAGPQEKKVNPE
jgi:hypothetical protein